MPRSKIKIFWDLMTCPMTRSYASLGEVLKDIRLFTSNFGVVTSMKAYYDKNATRPDDDPLRAAMPSMGVNLVDCSSMQGYTNDALAKMLSVDVVMSAMDDPINIETPEENIIMIISGDKSVLYPISLLMFRNYTVFLVMPDDDANTQLCQATRVFSWYRDVLACSLSPEPVSVTEPLSPGWVVNGTHVPQLSLDMPSVTTPPSNVISPRSVPSTHLSSPRQMTTATSPAATPGSKDTSIPPSEPPVSRAPSVLSIGSNPRASTSKPLKSFGTVATEPSNPRFPASPQIIPQAVYPEKNPSGNDLAADDWAAAGGWHAGGSWETAGLNWISEPASAPKPEDKTRQAPKNAMPLKQETKPAAQKEPQVRGQDSGSTWRTKTSTAKVDVQVPHDPPITVFDPLMRILREAENNSIMRSQLGEQLAKRKWLYQSAGVSGFGEFIALAAKRNLITLYGTDNHQQVKLKNRR